MSEQEQPKGFYEQKGMVRHMVILPETHKNKLKKLAKHYGITQGEVIEVFLDQADLSRLSQHFENKRASKGLGKTTKTDLIRKMKDLTPEQIAQIEAIIAKQAV